ncbi:MAG: metallophosphoesterase [Terriglobales bacterium]
MPLRFIHLSDIHFGQERGEDIYIHNDVRDQVLDDARSLREALPDQKVDGVIVTGDLAFSGTLEEYDAAGQFLDRLTEQIGCARTAVQVIPGNHDIHRKSISKASEWMLSEIAEKGADALDSFLQDEQDREVLYGRLRQYRKFAEAYNCPVDGTGGIAGQKHFPIGPARTLRFIGLNSALSCGKNDQQGKLILGAKQWVLPRTKGEELVVLCHHPLHWFLDSDAALKYVSTRARVFMSGHEHSPSFDVQAIETGCDLLVLAAGATTPPKESEIYKYTYNMIEFEWNQERESLRVQLFPRVWSNKRTRFEDNPTLPGIEKNPTLLGCPNFRSAHGCEIGAPAETATGPPESASHTGKPREGIQMDDDFALELLRFFRDLNGAQRLSVLIELGALPSDWSEPLNQSAERRALDRMRVDARLRELKQAIDTRLSSQGKGRDHT